MADSKIDLTGLTNPEPIAVQLLSEMLKKTFFKQSDLAQLVTVLGGIEFEEKIGYFGKLAPIGMRSANTGCSLNKVTSDLKASEKTWTPRPWDTEIVLCADDFTQMILEKAKRKGIDQFDLIDTEIMSIYVEYLEEQITEMYNRYIWLSERNAARFSDSPAGKFSDTITINGTTTALDLKLVNTNNGLWYRAMEIIAANPKQRITIAENDEASYALQDSEFTPAKALQVAKDLYYKAPLQIKQALKSGKYYYACTMAFYDKLTQNFETLGELESMNVNLIEGMNAVKVLGNNFVEVPEWDDMFNTYQNDGTKYEKPYRALLMSKENAVFGTPDLNTWGKFKMVFDDVNNKVHIQMKDKYDTHFIQDSLVMVAI